jgi:hypothetical protein
MFVLGKTTLQRSRRFKDVTKEVLLGTALTTRGALYLTPAETTKLRQILESPIPARKKYLRHLLLRLNALMLHPDLPPHFPGDATLEHVLPQKPSARSESSRCMKPIGHRFGFRPMPNSCARLRPFGCDTADPLPAPHPQAPQPTRSDPSRPTDHGLG